MIDSDSVLLDSPIYVNALNGTKELILGKCAWIELLFCGCQYHFHGVLDVHSKMTDPHDICPLRALRTAMISSDLSHEIDACNGNDDGDPGARGHPATPTPLTLQSSLPRQFGYRQPYNSTPPYSPLHKSDLLSLLAQSKGSYPTGKSKTRIFGFYVTTSRFRHRSPRTLTFYKHSHWRVLERVSSLAGTWVPIYTGQPPFLPIIRSPEVTSIGSLVVNT